MFRLGLTGGIGCGKSTVAKMFCAHGASLIDADAISRRLTAPNGAAMNQVKEQFGSLAVTPEGAMNREVMRQQIFTNPAAKQQLESIIHPLVGLECTRLTELAISQNRSLVVFDIPLLVESNRWRQQLHKILVVDCQEATQISRVLSRQEGIGSWTKATLVNVIAQQATRHQRRAAADWVIYNQGLTIEMLEQQVKQIAQHITL